MKKTDAFQAVKTLQAMPLSDEAQKLLADLHTYFLPSAPKAATVEAWVAKATDPKHPSEPLRYLYAVAGQLVGCNGHRLHTAPTGLPNGFYNAALDKVPSDYLEYPDFNRVIPAPGEEQFTWTEAPPVEGYGCGWYYVLPNGAHVNSKYWDEMRNKEKTIVYTQSGDMNYNPIRIDFPDGRLAVIMPIRQNRKDTES